jgi:hypothetical protein
MVGSTRGLMTIEGKVDVSAVALSVFLRRAGVSHGREKGAQPPEGGAWKAGAGGAESLAGSHQDRSVSSPASLSELLKQTARTSVGAPQRAARIEGGRST